ncbi:MAG TPA: NAD(P)H-dependent glycerol-3-phosphate dehydrogenase [Bryobacteraceae bacterium]|nr:NAD(P)H-dependent glycerol-3-phosphate dehydrogenase [Bryobacteraceae bacterium]
MKNLAIIGGGSWGTALAIVLSPRFSGARLWVYEQDLALRMSRLRENDLYLPGFRLPTNLTVTTDLGEALDSADLVMGVMPSHHARGLYSRMLPYLKPGMILVSATKGLEVGSLARMSQVVHEVVGERFQPSIAALSGPTFAREVARGEPAAVVIASLDLELARRIQGALSGPTLRLYTNSDLLGVELGAALKNVIAIGAGVCHGLGLGSNTMAALITRGLAEITRLSVAMGAKPHTLSGLAGLGDLVLTCTGELSRNRTVGLKLARGHNLDEILAATLSVAEGVRTAHAAIELAGRHGVEMPIARQMFEMLKHGKTPREAVRELMERALKSE